MRPGCQRPPLRRPQAGLGRAAGAVWPRERPGWVGGRVVAAVFQLTCIAAPPPVLIARNELAAAGWGVVVCKVQPATRRLHCCGGNSLHRRPSFSRPADRAAEQVNAALGAGVLGFLHAGVVESVPMQVGSTWDDMLLLSREGAGAAWHGWVSPSGFLGSSGARLPTLRPTTQHALGTAGARRATSSSLCSPAPSAHAACPYAAHAALRCRTTRSTSGSCTPPS